MAERDYAWRQAQAARKERQRARQKKRRAKRRAQKRTFSVTFEGGIDLNTCLAWWREEERRLETQG